MKTVLMIIANNGFQDHEFSATYETLLESGAQITLGAKRKGSCVGVFGMQIDVPYSLEELHGDKFEMVVFVGGGGALTQYIHNVEYLRIAKEAKKIGAICIAPMIVSESGVFNDLTVTSRDDEGLQKAFIEKNGGSWVDEPVVRCGNVVTANGPEAAELFGKECVKLLEDKIC